MSDRMKARLAVDSLASAVARRGGDVSGCVVHSDRGSPNFGRGSSCASSPATTCKGPWDKSPRPGTTPPWSPYFSLLQKNVLNRRRWATRAELRLAILTWIERTYHRRRRKVRLGRLTPIEYETINTTQTTLAA